MARTLIACAWMALLAYAAAAWLTRDFEVWTAESARREEVLSAPVAAPPVSVIVPGAGPRPLAGLLADGGGVTIVDFIYTRCNTVCSALGTGFQQMQARIRAEEGAPSPGGRVRLLSITFDRVHDDEAALAAYALRMRADGEVWRMAMVPDATELERLMAAFQVVVIPDGLGGFQHNAALLLVDRSGRLVRILDYSELDEALALARSLAARPGAA